MAAKKEYYKTYGEKLISFFVRLLFEDRYYSLNELVYFLGCSKSTVLRLINDVKRSYRVEIEEETRKRQKYVKLKRPPHKPQMPSLTEPEWHVLQMCRIFTQQLLGAKMFEEATQALFKSSSLRQTSAGDTSTHFACFRPGTIDYTPHHETIHKLIEAMNGKKVCRVTYKAVMQNRAKSFYIKPLKLFSHKDTIYLHARLARTPGTKYREPDFDPLLVVHRFNKVEITDINFTPPDDYNFEKMYNLDFGVMKEDAFKVKVELSGWAAQYAAERIWSQDQEIKKMGKNKIRLTFSASSDLELISWLLSFGEEAKVLEPDWVVEDISKKIGLLAKLYQPR